MVSIWDKAKVTGQGISVTIAFTVVRMRSHNGYPALLGQPWLELVRRQHDWSRNELTLGPRLNRVVLKLDVTQEAEEGETATYDGDLRVEANQELNEELEKEDESETKFWSFSSGEEEDEEEEEDTCVLCRL